LSSCGREGAGLRQGHEVRPVHVVREGRLAAKAPQPDVVEDAGGIEARAARRDGRTPSQLVILGNVPQFVPQYELRGKWHSTGASGAPGRRAPRTTTAAPRGRDQER
jgi:hypothetical protein